MKKNTLLAGVSALALIVAGCNADTGDNLGMNNNTEIVNADESLDGNLSVDERVDRLEANDNDPAN